jgi:hypothetical protein
MVFISLPTVKTESLATAWAPNTWYLQGCTVTYNASQYQCRQSHTSQSNWSPPETLSLWLRLAGLPSGCQCPSWLSAVSYKVGDTCFYGNNYYKCIQSHVAESNWQPEVTPALWATDASNGALCCATTTPFKTTTRTTTPVTTTPKVITSAQTTIQATTTSSKAATATRTTTPVTPPATTAANSCTSSCPVSWAGACVLTCCNGSLERLNYGSSESLTWTIAPPSATWVTVTFNKFNTESMYDELTFYSDASLSKSAIALGPLSGNNVPKPVVAVAPAAYLKWVSDSGGSRSGWAATWTCSLATDPTLRLGGTGASATCGRLEVRRQGVWGTVCDDSFDAVDAQVCCRPHMPASPLPASSSGRVCRQSASSQSCRHAARRV